MPDLFRNKHHLAQGIALAIALIACLIWLGLGLFLTIFTIPALKLRGWIKRSRTIPAPYLSSHRRIDLSR
jgi:hypothetical protein